MAKNIKLELPSWRDCKRIRLSKESIIPHDNHKIALSNYSDLAHSSENTNQGVMDWCMWQQPITKKPAKIIKMERATKPLEKGIDIEDWNRKRMGTW